MKKRKSMCRRLSVLLASALLFLFSVSAAQSVRGADEAAGTYELSAELSAYLAAMGGVEFGGPLMSGADLIIDEDGSEYLQLTFTKSEVTIYEITCDTFVDANPSSVTTQRGVEDGTLGIYDADGNLVTEGVTYTLSEDTALNSADEEVNYVASVIYPISSREDSYNLALYINSNVMGVEFCNENDDATEATYQATLTVDWSSLDGDTADSDADAGADTQEDTEDLEANEDLDGLSIYAAGDDDSNAGSAVSEEASADAESADSEESSTGSMLPVIVIAVIVIIVIIVIVFVSRNRKKKAEPEGEA